MRQRNVKNQDEIIDSFDRYVAHPEVLKGKWHNDYERVCLEIGIGKGQFIYNKAKMDPKTLYIGIELNKGVTALAIKKIIRLEQEDGIKCNNIRIFAFNAIELNQVFAKGEIDIIFLNFSDPWPKKKHEKRRLTSDMFLNVYKEILNENGHIEQKTDNRSLFEFSIMNFNKNKLNIEELSLNIYTDIAAGKITKNIPTEYEEKFRDKGPIYKIIVKFTEGII